MERIDLTWDGLFLRARKCVDDLWCDYPRFRHAHRDGPVRMFPVPNGGIFAALLMTSIMDDRVHLSIEENPLCADIYVDDVFDSGRTIQHIRMKYGDKPAFFLVDKEKEGLLGKWVSFPWERMAAQSGPEDSVTRLLQYIGEDPEREGLKETPRRVVRSDGELFAGYKQDPEELFKSFEDGACDQMVVLRDIEFVSFCEHHMMPFTGKAHIAYIPDGKVIGISKLARLLEVYSRRLQIQERLTQQITKALDDHLRPLGAACVLEASHSCMTCRGVGKQHSVMVTSSLTGVFREAGNEARQEFLEFIRR